jgi:type IV pilus assembly protein PilE
MAGGDEMKSMIKTRLGSGGFTLIEVLIAVVVIGVLAGIAIPNYSAYVNRSKRSAAKTVLLDTANQLERNYTTFGCYNKTSVAVCQSQAAGSDFTLPNVIAPTDGRPSYNVSFAALASQSYRLAATPCGTAGNCPAGSEAFVDSECGAFTLTQAGERAISGTGLTGTVGVCWQR